MSWKHIWAFWTGTEVLYGLFGYLYYDIPLNPPSKGDFPEESLGQIAALKGETA